MYVSSDNNSIFGDTSEGVPNPQVPHIHPYPTRHHGANWRWADTRDIQFVERPYLVPSMMGFGEGAKLCSYITDSSVGDAILGAMIGGLSGYLTARQRSPEVNAAIWGAAGAMLMYIGGLAGLGGLAAGIYLVEVKNNA